MTTSTKQNKKITIIGDIHGRDSWYNICIRELLDPEKENRSDLVVFLGDYFDTLDKSLTQDIQINNFKSIIEFKNRYPDKIILLFGNHDFHYYMKSFEYYSGYNGTRAIDIRELLTTNINNGNLQLVYNETIYGSNIWFSHAGISKEFINIYHEYFDNHNKLEESLNDILKFKPQILGFYENATDQYGDDPEQSPIWIRPKSLMTSKIDGWMVIGHTSVKMIGIESTHKIVLSDTLEQFLYCNCFIFEDSQVHFQEEII